MSLELFETDVTATLHVGEHNYLAEMRAALNHCPDHGAHYEIKALGFGKLTSESEYAFRFKFGDRTQALNYDANHKKPDMPCAEVHHPDNGPTINVGQPRMSFLLSKCGVTNPQELIQNAIAQYNKISAMGASHASASGHHHSYAKPVPLQSDALAVQMQAMKIQQDQLHAQQQWAAQQQALFQQQAHIQHQHNVLANALTELAVRPAWGLASYNIDGTVHLTFASKVAYDTFDAYMELSATLGAPLHAQLYGTGHYAVMYKKV